MSQQSNVVLVDIADGVMTITLNRAEKRNALSNEVYAGLGDAIEQAERDDAVRVVLLQAEGDVFCAGADLAEFSAANKSGRRGPRGSVRWVGGLDRIEKPVIAAVQGPAIGVGTTMLMHCDLICMADEASLRTPFVNLAVVPEVSSTYLIPQRIGYSRAYAMFALGEPVPAKTCVEWGLAHLSVPRTKLRETARTLAKTLADKPIGSLCATKRLIRDPEAIEAAAVRERAIFTELMLAKEAGAAFSAFVDKSKPGKTG